MLIVLEGLDGAGKSTQLRMLTSRLEESGRQVEFLGMLSQPELARAMNEAGSFILPSFSEGLPLVLAEAMACGCQLLCSDLPGIRQWLDENAPGHDCTFIPLPPLDGAGEPLADGLPAFRHRMADAIGERIGQLRRRQPELSALSWDGTAEKILRGMEQKAT